MDTREMQKTVEIAVKMALKDLYNAFENVHWPVLETPDKTSSNSIQEAVITMHLGCALKHLGFACFPETPYRTKDGKANRIDLFALNHDLTTAVFAEIKGDLAFVAPKLLEEAYERLTRVDPTNDYSGYYYKSFKWEHRIGVLMCYCWGDDLAQWWEQPDEEKGPPRRQSGLWEKMAEYLKQTDCKGSCLLADWTGTFSKNWEKFYGLYAVYALEGRKE
jgi:hypothetical protein